MENEITLTWGVDYMKSYPLYEGNQDVVCTVGWKLIATDGTYTSQIQGSSSIPVAVGPDFIPYELLTEAQVITWVQDVLGEDEVLELEKAVLELLNQAINPPEVTLPLPWAVVEEPAAPNYEPVPPDSPVAPADADVSSNTSSTTTTGTN